MFRRSIRGKPISISVSSQSVHVKDKMEFLYIAHFMCLYYSKVTLQSPDKTSFPTLCILLQEVVFGFYVLQNMIINKACNHNSSILFSLQGQAVMKLWFQNSSLTNNKISKGFTVP